MSSLYRALTDAAFSCKLNKNQLLAFNALMYQTLGFGKTKDPLTDKRLFELTGVRVDRLRPALAGVVKKGLFDRKPHKRYQYEYSIGKKYLEAHQDKVYPPSLPKKRSPSENENPISGNDKNLTETGQNPPEKAKHTITNQTLSNPQHTQTKPKTISNPQQTKPKTLINPPQTDKQTMNTSQSQQPQSVKLYFAELEQIPNNFAIETSAQTRIEFAIGNQDHQTTTAPEAQPSNDKNSEPSVTHSAENIVPSATHSDENSEPPVTRNAENIAKLRKLLALANKKTAPEETDDFANNINTLADHQPQQEPEQPAITANTIATKTDKESNKAKPITTPVSTTSQAKMQPPIPLPNAIEKAHHRACNNPFRVLSREQQKDVVLAFNYAFKTGTVNNPVGYFINLARSAKDGGLTVPTEALVNTTPSAEKLAADKAADEERQRHHELWSDFTWLRDNATLQETDMKTLAKQMGTAMEEAYATFAGVVS